MNAWYLAGFTLLSFAASAWATGWLRRFFMNRRILDYPNKRSSHQEPIPLGGGLVIVVLLTPAWAVIAKLTENPPEEVFWIIILALMLALPSFVDDLIGLNAMSRFLWQIIVCSVGTLILAGPEPVFQGYLPGALETAGTVFLWVGFINLFNFTDGIDGNAGSKATVIGIGVFLLALTGAVPIGLGQLGLITSGVTAGFLLWNWNPARIFMGDVGSVTLGFLLAWLLLRTAGEGHWAPAMILPFVYLTDTGLTYLAKIARREKFWLPHRDHYYQRVAHRPGVTHAQIVRIIVTGDVILIGLAILAARGLVWPSLLGAGLTSAAVITHLNGFVGEGSEL